MADAEIPCPSCGQHSSDETASPADGGTHQGIGAILVHGALIPFILAIVLVVQRESSFTILAIAFAIPVLMMVMGRLLLHSHGEPVCGTCRRPLPRPGTRD
jgi:hypothetical protein